MRCSDKFQCGGELTNRVQALKVDYDDCDDDNTQDIFSRLGETGN